jgi:ADP-ribose pyrophosphatase YjhB (NUDIX family)
VTRVDYYDDPSSPTPNSLVVAASVAVTSNDGELLMVKRTDSGNWSLPGGTMALGESVSQCAVRELLEETGLEVEIIGIVGIYSDPKHVIEYSDGEVRQQFNICLRGRIIGGTLTRDNESTAIAFHHPATLDALPMHPSQRLRINDYLTNTQRVL